jgi:putative oxidoreductase
MLIQTHVPLAHLFAWVAPLTELLGGLAILIGLFVSVVKTIGLTPQGPVFGPPGIEINLLYIAGLISLILTGAGSFSVDAARAGRKVRAS